MEAIPYDKETNLRGGRPLRVKGRLTAMSVTISVMRLTTDIGVYAYWVIQVARCFGKSAAKL
jgi:hypothetical protein